MRTYPVPHEFDEDVEDGSMCMCGVPALGHEIVEPIAKEATNDEH